MEFRKVAEGEDFEAWELQESKGKVPSFDGERDFMVPVLPKKIDANLFKKVMTEFTNVEAVSMSKSGGVSVRIKREVKK